MEGMPLVLQFIDIRRYTVSYTATQRWNYPNWVDDVERILYFCMHRTPKFVTPVIVEGNNFCIWTEYKNFGVQTYGCAIPAIRSKKTLRSNKTNSRYSASIWLDPKVLIFRSNTKVIAFNDYWGNKFWLLRKVLFEHGILYL